MDDLDDLLDEASPIKEVSHKLGNLNLKRKTEETQDWEEMDLKVNKPSAAQEDEWGDLAVEQKQPDAPKPLPAKKQEPEEDDWGTYETPVIKKNSEKEK